MDLLLKYTPFVLSALSFISFLILIVAGKIKNGEINLFKGVFKFNGNKQGFVSIDKDEYIDLKIFKIKDKNLRQQIRVAKDETRLTLIKQQDYFAEVFKLGSNSADYEAYSKVFYVIKHVALQGICELIENNGFSEKEGFEWQSYKEVNRNLIWEDCMNEMRSLFPLLKMNITREQIAELAKPTFKQLFADGLDSILEQCKSLSILKDKEIFNFIGGLQHD